MLEQILSEEEAVAKVKETVLDLQGDRWMVAFWRVEEGKEQNTLSFAGRVSWKFPIGDYEKCVEMLKENMEGEVKAAKPPIPAPLDVADWLKPKEEIVCNCEELTEKEEEERVKNVEVSPDWKEAEKVDADEIDRLFNPAEEE